MTTEIEQASRDFMAAANRLPTFYDLGAQWNTLLAMLESDEPDEQAIQTELNQLAGDIKAKAYGIAAVIQTLKRMAEMQAAEASRLAAKAKANENHVQRLKDYAKSVMQSMECERIDTGLFTLAIVKNPPSVVVEDEVQVPNDFRRRKIIDEVDKQKILSNHKATGEIPPGVSIVRTERLDLR